jgi:hypothetical protein
LLKDEVDGIIKINNNAFIVWKMTEFIIQVNNTEKAGKAKAYTSRHLADKLKKVCCLCKVVL